MKKTAKFIKKIEGGQSDARLYFLSEPVLYDSDKETSYVYVSAANVDDNPALEIFPKSIRGSGDETFIFPCDKKGEVLSWYELEGSTKGILSHKISLNKMGFETDLD